MIRNDETNAGIAVALAVPALLAAQRRDSRQRHASRTAKSKLIPSEHARNRPNREWRSDGAARDARAA